MSSKARLSFIFKKASYLLVACLVALTSLTCSDSLKSVWARPFDIAVSPTKLELVLAPGQVREGSFTVVNQGGDALKFKVYASPYSVQDEDYNATDFSTQTLYTKLSDWVELPQQSFSLQAGQQRRIAFKVRCPKLASPGGQYASLFAEVESSAAAHSRASMNVNQRVGCLLYAKVAGQINYQGQVDFVNNDWLHLGGDLGCAFKVVNGGNVDFNVSFGLSARPLLGGKAFDSRQGWAASDSAAKVFQPIQRSILPGTTRAINQIWPDPVSGLYQVSEEVEYLGRAERHDFTVLVCPPWLISLAAAIAVVILACLAKLAYNLFTKKRRRAQRQTLDMIQVEERKERDLRRLLRRRAF